MSQTKAFSRLNTLCTHLVWMRIADIWICSKIAQFKCRVQNSKMSFTVMYKRACLKSNPLRLLGRKIRNFWNFLKRFFCCDRSDGSDLAHHAQWSEFFFLISKNFFPILWSYNTYKNILRRKCLMTFFDLRPPSPFFGPLFGQNFT